MAQKQYNNKKRPQQAIATPAKRTKEVKPKHPWQLIVKLVIILAIAVSCVAYTDSRGFFLSDQMNRHHERRWESFYKLTQQDTLDVIILGSSHAFCGINPKNLSAALGCNCFVMAFNASTTPDAYFVLKEVLTRTTPKIVILETYNLRNLQNHNLNHSDLSNQFRSFYPRRNIPIKLASMPVLFTLENYLPAWSSTLRNHEILFKNPEEIGINIKIQKTKKRPDKKLYLGRFVRFTSGITDSVMRIYDTAGPTVDGLQMDVSDEEIVYAKKIVDLCHSKNIQPMFLTIPIYYKNVKDIEAWTRNICKAIEPTRAPWLNLQYPYDTLQFDKNCFESIHEPNQHMTYYGSLVATYKLAHYIVDSLHVALPDRSKSLHWHEMFYGEEGYFENYTPKNDDPKYTVLLKDTLINDYYIKDITVDTNGVVNLKLQCNEMAPPHEVTIDALIDYKGQPINGRIVLQKNSSVFSFKYHHYNIQLIQEAKVKKIIRIY